MIFSPGFFLLEIIIAVKMHDNIFHSSVIVEPNTENEIKFQSQGL